MQNNAVGIGTYVTKLFIKYGELVDVREYDVEFNLS